MSSNNITGYTPAQKQQLLNLARTAIQKRLQGESFTVPTWDYPASLRVPRASFVTLHVDAQLHGCIGTLEARRPLVEDVAHNARAAAFEDPRFPALTASEFERLHIHISVLGTPEPMQFESEEGLLRQLRPHVDGLILEAGPHRGTFLPAVWDELPVPHDFLCHLKRKAGLPADYWSRDLRVRRYTVESIP
ncbi:MAG: AmmeMemoRadiSam system protein A [Pseudomonadota bacterium]